MSRSQTISHLKSACQIYAIGVQTRNFDASSPLYYAVLQSSFVAEFDLRNSLNRVQRNLQESLEFLEDFVKDFPGYQVHITNIDVRLDERKGEADVFSIMEEKGRGDGDGRQTFVLQRWKRIEGKWWCLRYEGVRGMSEGRVEEWSG